MTYNLAVWFMEVYGDWGYIAPAFVMPENVVQPDYESIIKEQEEKIVALSKQVMRYPPQHRPRHPRNVRKRVKPHPRAWIFPRLKPAI